MLMTAILTWLCVCAAVLFLEHWKRRQISLSFSWDLTGIEEDEVNTSSAQRAAHESCADKHSPSLPMMLFFSEAIMRLQLSQMNQEAFLFLDVFLTRKSSVLFYFPVILLMDVIHGHIWGGGSQLISPENGQFTFNLCSCSLLRNTPDPNTRPSCSKRDRGSWKIRKRGKKVR